MIKLSSLINRRVQTCYWVEDLNCTITLLKIMSSIFNIDLSRQVLDAATGMHGAGSYQAQCGLVEGSLMFIGIIGKHMGYSSQEIEVYCYNLAYEFEEHFGSLVCRELRPEGFNPDNPPHLCEEITKQAVLFTADYIMREMKLSPAKQFSLCERC